MKKNYFTEEMKEKYTILIPTMLPIHFNMIINMLKNYGYKIEQLDENEFSTIDYGLKYVHNDICYPAMVVIGQLLEAVESGKYDKDKIALMITQTGGGCRASNYISLLKKALIKAGYPQIPVVSLSLSFGKIDNNLNFKFTPPMILKIAYSILYADLIMLLKNQCLPYEVNQGETMKTVNNISSELIKELSENKIISYKKVKKNYRYILEEFSKIKLDKSVSKPKVGIVGEIFVKYSPVGNNKLESFLNSEGAEVVMPGLFDFMLYCIVNQIMDYELYGMNKNNHLIIKFVYNVLIDKQNELIDLIKEYPSFTPPSSFEQTRTLIKDYINPGMKMGEGWLLTAEMLELIHTDVKNIICVQPFGCLPNHIAGKGMMKKIKERNSNVNIVAIDYDPGASKVNQENRIKLMLSNTKTPL